MAEEKTLNGIDPGQLRGAVRAMKEDAQQGKLVLRASNKWIKGAHGQTTIKGFCHAGKEDTSRSKAFVLEADEPRALLGEDHGPNATEAALHALASCLNTTFIYHAVAQGVKVDELELELEGDLDLRGFLGISDEVKRGYKNIRVTFKVKADAPKEKIEQLCELAKRHSPVYDVVTPPTPVDVRLEIK